MKEKKSGKTLWAKKYCGPNKLGLKILGSSGGCCEGNPGQSTQYWHCCADGLHCAWTIESCPYKLLFPPFRDMGKNVTKWKQPFRNKDDKWAFNRIKNQPDRASIFYYNPFNPYP